MLKKKESLIFYDKDKKRYPFQIWYKSLENHDKYKVSERIKRLEDGNYGDYKSVGNNILELRFKQGFRIYFTEVNNTIVIILCGGDKSSKSEQSNDIKHAKMFLEDYRSRL